MRSDLSCNGVRARPASIDPMGYVIAGHDGEELARGDAFRLGIPRVGELVQVREGEGHLPVAQVIWATWTDQVVIKLEKPKSGPWFAVE